MFKLIIALSVLSSIAAFAPTRSLSKASMRISAAEEQLGALPPVGFFDPLGLSAGKSEATMKLWREAELKHGRVSMLAFLGILIGENFNPLFNHQITGPAIYQFQQADEILSYFWVIVLFSIACFEGQNILDGWEPDRKRTSGQALLRDDYVNGDLGFDPLGLAAKYDFDEMRTKELQNGRLAMLGVAGIVAQELVTNQKVLELPYFH